MELHETQSTRGGSAASVVLVASIEETKPIERKRRRKPEKDAIRRIMKRVAAGASVLAACRAEGVPRTTFLKAVEKDERLRADYSFAITARAHALADELTSIADGKDSAEEVGERIAQAVLNVAPEKVEAVARGIAREQIQRDRLRFDCRRWLASRLLPAVYGAQAVASPVNRETVVRVTFDPLPDYNRTTEGGGSIQEADYEVL